MLTTKLEAQAFPPALFADLYHQRWRIEDAFERLKHRVHLEAVLRLSQQALNIHIAAKVLANDLTSLMWEADAVTDDLPGPSRKCHQSYAADESLKLAGHRRCYPGLPGADAMHHAGVGLPASGPFWPRAWNRQARTEAQVNQQGS